jgi:hypothetical protein
MSAFFGYTLSKGRHRIHRTLSPQCLSDMRVELTHSFIHFDPCMQVFGDCQEVVAGRRASLASVLHAAVKAPLMAPALAFCKTGATFVFATDCCIPDRHVVERDEGGCARERRIALL